MTMTPEQAKAAKYGAEVSKATGLEFAPGKTNVGVKTINLKEAQEIWPARTVNLEARERIESQISDLILDLNKDVRAVRFGFKTALDLLGMARSSVYTEPLGEVSQCLREAVNHFRAYFPERCVKLENLANVSLEVMASEIPGRVDPVDVLAYEYKAKEIAKAFNKWIVPSLGEAVAGVKRNRIETVRENVKSAMESLENIDTKSMALNLKMVLNSLDKMEGK